MTSGVTMNMAWGFEGTVGWYDDNTVLEAGGERLRFRHDLIRQVLVE